MEFKRIKVKGQSQKVAKEWRSDCGAYLIRWRTQACGVEVQPAYYALVKCVVNGRTVLHFAAEHRPYATLKKATEACQLNRKLWTLFVELGDATGNRRARLLELDDRSKVGRQPFGSRIYSMLPLWVAQIADPKLLQMLFPPTRSERRHLELAA